MKYSNKKEVVWNVFRNNGLKDTFKVLGYIVCSLHFERTLRINYEKYDEKCYDQWYLSISLNTYNY